MAGDMGFDDLDTFAANALTDSSNDKKCDLVAVHRDSQRLIIAQGYETDKEVREAPANKASDLNTAVTWVLAGDLDRLTAALASAAKEARQALADEVVHEVEIWYVHNLPESVNVQTELEQATRTADSLIRSHFPGVDVNVSAHEVGRGTLEEDYKRTQVPILVTESISFKIPGGFEIRGEGWSAYLTAIGAAELRRLWGKHEAKLLSPNIRDYLGIVRSTGNINHAIKQTAIQEPGNFAIYNNGITVLVNDYSMGPEGEGWTLTVEGMGVVNGGQTTGAVGTLSETDAATLGEAQVMARFVKCSRVDVLSDIVRYNNTQNKVEATDFRSKDATQERLRKEFSSVPEAEYRGGRRGGVSDAIQRSRTLLPDSSVAQALAAFHGSPNLAYNETRTIWDVDGVYANVFTGTVTARHIVFVFGLLKAVERAKQQLNKVVDVQKTEPQKRHTQFFSGRGSNFLLVAAISGSIETILLRPVVDKHALMFKNNVSPAAATDEWQPIVDLALAFSSQLVSATDQGLKWLITNEGVVVA